MTEDYQDCEKNISGIISTTAIGIMEPKMDIIPTTESNQYEAEENKRFVVVQNMTKKGHRTSHEQKFG